MIQTAFMIGLTWPGILLAFIAGFILSIILIAALGWLAMTITDLALGAWRAFNGMRADDDEAAAEESYMQGWNPQQVDKDQAVS